MAALKKNEARLTLEVTLTWINPWIDFSVERIIVTILWLLVRERIDCMNCFISWVGNIVIHLLWWFGARSFPINFIILWNKKHDLTIYIIYGRVCWRGGRLSDSIRQFESLRTWREIHECNRIEIRISWSLWLIFLSNHDNHHTLCLMLTM